MISGTKTRYYSKDDGFGTSTAVPTIGRGHCASHYGYESFVRARGARGVDSVGINEFYRVF